MKRTAALLLLVLAAACGSSTPATLGSSPSASPTPAPIPSFAAPEAAMTYLADAWNRHDLVELKHVTNPIAREALESMRVEAINLRLTKCTYNDDRRDYDCSFTHDFPAGYTGHEHGTGYKQAPEPGTANFVVGPASRSGWYMTVLESCG